MQKPEYVEIEFLLPIQELFYPSIECTSDEPKNPHELAELCSLMNVKMDFEDLYDSYWKGPINQGDIMIYHTDHSLEEFIIIDLYHDEKDQVNMVNLGVRIKLNQKEALKGVLEKLYFKSSIKGAWQEHYHHQPLSRKALQIGSEHVEQMTKKVTYEFKKNVRPKRHFQNGEDITTA